MENFKTHITFTTGDKHIEDTTEDNLVSTVSRLTSGPAALLGMIDTVEIIDVMDRIIFKSKNNKIIFPNIFGWTTPDNKTKSDSGASIL